ncbi:hypothetical protein FG95_02454 [Sphingopyxis sp. LC363]|nr:hypothetical protein FG95_02454 [Sphingopyxis sp. LC363]
MAKRTHPPYRFQALGSGAIDSRLPWVGMDI